MTRLVKGFYLLTYVSYVTLFFQFYLQLKKQLALLNWHAHFYIVVIEISMLRMLGGLSPGITNIEGALAP